MVFIVNIMLKTQFFNLSNTDKIDFLPIFIEIFMLSPKKRHNDLRFN